MRLCKGQIVQVECIDHCQEGSEPLEFTAFGRLAKITPVAICIDSWCYTDRRKPCDTNINRFTIVRSAIKRIVQLEERKG